MEKYRSSDCKKLIPKNRVYHHTLIYLHADETTTDNIPQHINPEIYTENSAWFIIQQMQTSHNETAHTTK